MKILITGCNGLLGQKLVKLILEKGEKVIATSHSANRIDYLNESFEFKKMDIRDANDVNMVIADCKPDVVINTAAMTNVDQCETDKEECIRLNVEAVTHLVKACEANNVFLLHLSTDFIFDGEDGPYKEEATANPLSFYGQSKLDAERALQASNIDWAIARTVLVYGVTPGMSRSNIILWVKGSLENNKTINVVDDQWRTPTLAEDLAMGCFLISKKKAKGVFNISGPDLLTPYEMAIATADFYGLDRSLINKADASTFAQPAKRPPKTGFILDKAKEKLGYDPKSFKEGMAFMSEQVDSSNN